MKWHNSLVTSLIILMITSCSVQKRKYVPGYHIQTSYFKKGSKSVEQIPTQEFHENKINHNWIQKTGFNQPVYSINAKQSVKNSINNQQKSHLKKYAPDQNKKIFISQQQAIEKKHKMDKILPKSGINPTAFLVILLIMLAIGFIFLYSVTSIVSTIGSIILLLSIICLIFFNKITGKKKNKEMNAPPVSSKNKISRDEKAKKAANVLLILVILFFSFVGILILSLMSI